jgi:hypothetical protein
MLRFGGIRAGAAAAVILSLILVYMTWTILLDNPHPP